MIDHAVVNHNVANVFYCESSNTPSTGEAVILGIWIACSLSLGVLTAKVWLPSVLNLECPAQEFQGCNPKVIWTVCIIKVKEKALVLFFT